MSKSSKKPTYQLVDIKSSLKSIDTLNTTQSALLGAYALGMDEQDIIDAIQQLDNSDFHKTMSPINPKFLSNHDVYKTKFNGFDVYCKFQKVGNMLLVSFKRDESA